MRRKIKFEIKRILACLLVAAQMFTQISLPVIAEDGVSDNSIPTEEVVIEEVSEEVNEIQEDSEIIEEVVEPIVEENVEEEIIDEPLVEDVIEEEVIDEQVNQEEVIDEGQSDEEPVEEVALLYAVKIIDSVTGETISETELEENAEFDLNSVEVSEHEGYVFEGFYVADTQVQGIYTVVAENVEIIVKYSEIEEEVVSEDIVYPEFSSTEGSVGIMAAEGVLPEGTEIKAEEKEDTNVEYELLLEELNNDLELVDENTFAEVTALKVVDITLDNNGETIQPQGNVEVTIDFEIKEDRQYFAYYLNDSTPERLESEVVENGVKFVTDHFSTYAVAEVELMATLAEGEATTFADTCTYTGNEDIFTLATSSSGNDLAGTYYYLDDEGTLWIYNDGTSLEGSSRTFENITKTDVLAVKYTTDCNVINLTKGTSLFSGFINCTSIDLSKVDTSNCTDLSLMFNNCKAITYIDVTQFDTKNVKKFNMMFFGCNNLTNLNVSGFITTSATNMSSMFSGCNSLTSLNVTGFNTSNVTSMASMFTNCSSLTSLDVSGFNTSNVTYMGSMFSGCKNITILDISGFDTSKVETMSSMFSGCTALTSINVSNLNTVSVTNMNMMFQGMTNLINIDISAFNLSNVTNMQGMFLGCESLKEIVLPSISVSNKSNFVPNYTIWCNSNDYTTDIRSLLVGTDTIPAGTYVKCYSVTYKTNDGNSDVVEYAKADTLLSEKVLTRESYEFGGWYKDIALTSAWNYETNTVTANTTLYAKWISVQYKVTFDSNFDDISVADQSVAYNGVATEPTVINKGYTLIGWYTDNITFQNKWDFDTVVTEDITLYAKWEINLFTGNYIGSEAWFTLYPNSTDTYYYLDDNNVLWLYGDNSSISSTADANDILNTEHGVDVSDIKEVTFTNDCGVINVYDMKNMFKGFGVCESIDVSKFDTSNCINMSNLFYNCAEITELDLSTFNTSNVTDMSDMFINCNKITELDLSAFNTSNVTTMAGMFQYTGDLINANLSSFDTSNVTDMSRMFSGCGNRTADFEGVDLSGFDTSNVTTMQGMFLHCYSLQKVDISNFDISNTTNMSNMFGDCKCLYEIKIPTIDSSVNKSGFLKDGIWHNLSNNETFSNSKMNANTLAAGIYVVAIPVGYTTYTDMDMDMDARAGYIAYNQGVNKQITREHYTFGGWYLDESFTDEYDESDVNEQISYVIEYKDYLGDFRRVNSRTESIASIMKESVIMFYAKWEANKYTVTFNSNNGSLVADQEIAYNEKVIEPTVPTKENSLFKGWYKDSACVTPWNFESDIVTGNTVLYAKWVTACTVTFSNTGDSSVASQVVGYEEYVTEPTEPTKTYYEFAGWYKDLEFTTEWDFANDKVTEDITLYAKWNPGKCEVSFNEGVYTDRVVDKQYVTINELATNPGDLVSIDDEYVFVGWYTGLTKWDFETDIVTCDMTLEAKWVHKSTTYTVKFESTDKFTLDLDIPDQVVNAGGYATKPVTPTKSVDFWFCSGNYYTEIAKLKEFDFENTPILGNITLYYSAEAGKNVAYYDINDTSREYEMIDTFYVKSGTTLERPVDPTSTIGEFIGWYDGEPINNTINNDRFWDFSTPVTYPLSLYAIYALKYNVTFDSNGGSTVTSQAVFENSTVTEPTEPTKEHYVFKGWYTDNTYSTKWDFANDRILEDTILYAKWEAEKYTVIFNSNGGTTVANQTVEYNNKVTSPTAPTKDHYVFKGWYTDNTFSTKWVFDTDLVTENVTLFAKWEAEVYTVTFNSNGGTEIVDQEITYNEKVTEPAAPTKDHYVFKGWFVDSACNTEWVFNTDLVVEDTILFAKWEAEVYTVSFEVNGGSSIADQNVTYNEKVVEPTAPTKAKAEFIGWYSDSTLNTPWNFDTKVTTDVTLYAKWIDTYEVSFNSNGGTTVAKQIVRENEKVTVPTEPTRETYIFVGWYTDNALTVEYDFNTVVTSDFTLYAKWEGKLEHQKDVEQETPIEFTWDDTVDEVKDAIKDDEDAAYDKTNNYWTAIMNVTPADVATLESTYSELQNAADTYEYSMAFDITINKYISTDSDVKDVLESTNITETKKPLVISFSAPELPAKKAIDEYTFYRVHEGVLEEIPVKFDRESNLFTFESDKFSEFAFYYEIADLYTVTFECNGGSTVGSQDIIEGYKVTEPTVPTREGFEFMGWYSDSALTDEYDFETVVSEDITLYAKWKKEVKEPTPTPGTDEEPKDEEPKDEDEDKEEPKPLPLPEPTPIPPVIPTIPMKPVSEDEDKETFAYIPTTLVPVQEEVIVNNKEVTYVRTLEYGYLVDNKELKKCDVNLFK